MTRPTVRSMILEDLGYCCLWFFFDRYKKTALIAARLGVSERAVRYTREGCGGCAGNPNCLRKKLTDSADTCSGSRT